MTDVTAPETHSFQAEVNQVLNLVIHSLYSHKEVFLRELISNASDALDKLRFRAITEPDLLRDDPALEVRIVPDKTAGTLTIEDNGIGMTREELLQNLGTIAHSGSRGFLDAVAGKNPGDLNLIGQFGVGFYSAYLVADSVEVISRSASDGSAAFRWQSEAKESYTLEPAVRAQRGTAVILHLREDQRHFLDEWQLRELITRYSDYVSHPIRLQVAPAKPGELEAKFETVNRASALWQRPKNEIADAQYEEFYKHLTRDSEAPLARLHFRVEGGQEFVSLLFIPRHPPIDVHLSRERRGMRLFVRRIFVMDNCEELLPPWLRFVRGVIDSDDLPLNVSREVLQDSGVVRAIRKQVTKRILDLLEELASRPADYALFWKAFGPVLKEGLALELEQRDRLAKLVRYRSSRGDELVSLDDYVKRMPAGQAAIYYAFGDSQQVLAAGPHLEVLQKRGYEVLYMTDPIDEWAAEGLGEFEHKPLVSAMRADLKLKSDGAEDSRAEQTTVLKALLERIRVVLQEQVQEVRVSDRLTGSPCCLVIPEGGHHAYMERLLRSSGQPLPGAKRILEINPSHPLIRSLKAREEREPKSERVTEWIEMLYDQALLTEGSAITDPNRFARRMTALLEGAVLSAPDSP